MVDTDMIDPRSVPKNKALRVGIRPYPATKMITVSR